MPNKTVVPTAAQFKTLADAIEWRKEHGGWVFASEKVFIWMESKNTPTQVITHPITRGLSGRLI